MQAVPLIERRGTEGGEEDLADFFLLRRGGRLVQTDMGNTGARLFGMHEAPVPTKDSVAGVVAQVRALKSFVLRCTQGGVYILTGVTN